MVSPLKFSVNKLKNYRFLSYPADVGVEVLGWDARNWLVMGFCSSARFENHYRSFWKRAGVGCVKSGQL